MSNTRRIAVINTHPIQYFAPLYAYLNRDPDIEITALYCSNFSLRGEFDSGFKQTVAWDVDLMSGYDAVFLGDAASRRNPAGFWSLICLEVWREVRSGKYDAIWLNGYNYAVYLIAFVAAKTKGLPVFMRSETHLGLRRPRWKRWLRDSVLSIVYRWINGFFVIGSANRAYYRSLGVPQDKIFDVPYTVDNERFISASELTAEQRADVRKEYGLPADKPVVLFASKFMPRKHPADVIRAMERLWNQGLSASLFMVGSGELDQDLRDLSTSLGIMDSVVFGGFINQAALPRVYAGCDVFVLPSENEPWGLIVNEAMCAGLPVVVSSEVGCVYDLVKDGDNGYRISSGSITSLETALEKILTDEERRHRMGEASLSIIQGWSYEQCRKGIAQAVESGLKNR